MLMRLVFRKHHEGEMNRKAAVKIGLSRCCAISDTRRVRSQTCLEVVRSLIVLKTKDLKDPIVGVSEGWPLCGCFQAVFRLVARV